LNAKTPNASPATLTVTVLAHEALRRLKSPVAASDAVRIDVGELVMTDALLLDRSVQKVYVEIDALDLDGGTPLRTVPIAKNARKLDFEFSQALSVPSDSKEMDSLRLALKSSEEEVADVYFTLKGSSATGEKELAQGFVNLQELMRNGKDHLRTPLKLASNDRNKSYGPLTVSVAALDV
jgi:hypothetical protein